MQIRVYVRHLEKFLQQGFNKLNLSLYVSRRSKHLHIGLDILLLSTRVSSELVAIIKNFEKENRDPKYYFAFPRVIHTTKWKYDYIIFERKKYYVEEKVGLKTLNLLISLERKLKVKLYLADVMSMVFYYDN